MLPINILDLKDLRPQQWVALIHTKLKQVDHLSVIQAKAKFLEVLQTWPLFGSTFFYVKVKEFFAHFFINHQKIIYSSTFLLERLRHSNSRRLHHRNQQTWRLFSKQRNSRMISFYSNTRFYESKSF